MTEVHNTNINDDFRRRIDGALKTVQAWEDPVLLAECRATIPWEDLREDDTTSTSAHATPALRFLQRLCRHFQKTMTWINQPACPHCHFSSTLLFQSTRAPHTPQEIQGQASRVELYKCPQCLSDNIPFPRYNHPRTLLQTRQGRCGEYANLFGLVCRAAGFHTRYILDVTDHVWIEVALPSSASSSSASSCQYYCMADGCEGVIDQPHLYEHGWGKALSYILAVTPDYVMEVTPRYTRQFYSQDFSTRRRTITTSEQDGQAVLQRINQTLGSQLSAKQRQRIVKQCAEEQEELEVCKQLAEWNEHMHQTGRISGSMEWKLARGEIGKQTASNSHSVNAEDKNATLQSTEYTIQSFLPTTQLRQAYLALNPRPSLPTQAIIVSAAACAMGLPNQLSTVVVDPVEGTVLLSKSFVSLQDLQSFVETLVDTQILIVHGQLMKCPDDGNDHALHETALQRRLFLWNADYIWNGGILYMGAVGETAEWTVCASILQTIEPIVLRWNSTAVVKELKCRTHPNTRPHAVMGRLPDSILPLDRQIASNFAQKQQVFESFLESSSSYSGSIVGFCSKPGAPIYLLSAKAYPLQPISTDWVTVLRLPAWLVPEEDENGGTALDPLSYEVPLQINAFVDRLGPQLLRHNQMVETAVALKNHRLIAFYFSAHWCGPCRSFTPMLTEFYHVLREAFPSRGLEIVLVSSDRDENSFQNYYRNMPWLAIPFHVLEHYKSMLSFQYDVQGIPSLVILDAVSGAVVVDARQSRSEIQLSCRRGENGILEQFDLWLQRLPLESQEILHLLQVSCYETNVTPAAKKTKDRPDDALLESYSFAHTNNAAVPLVRSTLPTRDDWEREWRESLTKDDWTMVLTTALQYINNARREPWNPKYRTFHWSNSVADRISRVLFGLEWWCQQDLEVFMGRDNVVAWIPPHVDLDVLQARWSALMG